MTQHLHPSARRRASAFTLVELMVSVSILVILMLVVSNFIGLVQRTWVRTNSNVSQFREARIAFDIMTRTVSQATLNTYWQPLRTQNYTSLGQSIFTASAFRRTSELQFICGPTAGGGSAVFPGAGAGTFPGHAVFFQAPLGVTGLISTNENETTANTQNMVNLMCGRGYFVAWGDDAAFRPDFLANRVPTRNRLRLMEFSPTAEQNRIYDSDIRPLVSATTGLPENSRQWYIEAANSTGGTASALTQIATEGTENASNRSFTRPVAENILALIISPQMPSVGAAGINPFRIAPNYAYDSLEISNPGADVTAEFGPQGTQHVLPPVLKITMIALDARSGERLSNDTDLLDNLIDAVDNLFQTVANYEDDLRELENVLITNRLAYRVFSTSIPLKQARWSR